VIHAVDQAGTTHTFCFYHYRCQLTGIGNVDCAVVLVGAVTAFIVSIADGLHIGTTVLIIALIALGIVMVRRRIRMITTLDP
jgi:hypothetical protein